MPTLPKSLAAVRAAVASLLWPICHFDNLYTADDIANALNIAADVDGCKDANAKVDVTLLLRAFANDAAEFVLPYAEHFCRDPDSHVLYIRRIKKPGRHEGKGQIHAVFGRFSSMEAAKRAHVVRWTILMHPQVRAGLVCFLKDASKPKVSKKKRPVIDISPDNAGENDENRPPLRSLVAIQPLQPRDEPPAVIHYTLGGRAGKMTVPSNGLLLVKKLRQNLEPLTYTDTDITKRKRDNKRFRIAVFGSVSVWVPTGSSLVASNQLSRLEEDSERVAKIYLNWLGAADEGHDMEDYCFPSKVIKLENHVSCNATIEINTRECMEYLTLVSDPKKILEDRLIKNNKELLWQMASADEPVDLFDESTWPNDIDFNPLLDVVHNVIAPHMCQNQRIESYVQMHAVVAKTNVKEVRRSARAMLHCTIVRPFNQESVARKRATIENIKHREKIKRVKGRERILMFGKYVNELNVEIDAALADISDDLYDQVLRDMSSDENKSSADETQQQIDMYERGAKKKRNVTKSEENPNGMTITPEMGGKIVLSVLQKGKGHADHVHAEIQQRGIEPPMPLKDMKWKEVIDLLRLDEYQTLVRLELARSIEHWKGVREIDPQSDKMMELFEHQEDYFLEKQTRQTKL